MIQAVAKAPAQTPRWFWLVQWGSPALLLTVAWIPFGEPVPLPLQLLFTLMAVLLAVVFLVAPRRLSYALMGEGLRVGQLSSTATWPYAGLHARQASGHLGVKLAGMGVAGYYTGRYHWKGEGPSSVQAVASRLDRGVFVDSGRQTYFLTPADPAGFLQQLRQRGATVLN